VQVVIVVNSKTCAGRCQQVRFAQPPLRVGVAGRPLTREQKARQREKNCSAHDFRA
jgi:hypothetical protein